MYEKTRQRRLAVVERAAREPRGCRGLPGQTDTTLVYVRAQRNSPARTYSEQAPAKVEQPVLTTSNLFHGTRMVMARRR